MLVLLTAAPAAAQTVTADRFQFKTGPCTLRSGTGSPEGVVAGKVCDTFWRTDTGQIYQKTSGTGNTGWTLPGGVSGTGTTNSIAKWTNSSTIGNASITDDAATVTVMPTGNVVFNNGGDLVFNPTGNDVLPTTGYDINIGALTNKFLALHAAELWVETLVAQNTMATIGGRILVAPTTLLTADLTTGATSIIVKHNNLASGDRVYLEANGNVEFLAITNNGSGAGPYTYTVTRNLDGTGANAWAAGDAILNTGQTGNGFIDLYSVRGVKAGTEIGPDDCRQRPQQRHVQRLVAAVGHRQSQRLVWLFGLDLRQRLWPPDRGPRDHRRHERDPASIGGDNDQKVSIDTSGNAIFDGQVTIGSGTNIIRNSECRVGTDEWTVAHNTGLTPVLSFNEGAAIIASSVGRIPASSPSPGTPANNTSRKPTAISFRRRRTGSMRRASMSASIGRKRRRCSSNFNAAAALLTSPSATICDVSGVPISVPSAARASRSSRAPGSSRRRRPIRPR